MPFVPRLFSIMKHLAYLIHSISKQARRYRIYGTVKWLQNMIKFISTSAKNDSSHILQSAFLLQNMQLGSSDIFTKGRKPSIAFTKENLK